MIAVDTSALMAVILNEAGADACVDVLATETDILISAGTLAEALLVAEQRNVGVEMANLIERLEFEVVPITESAARRVAQAYARWGKGGHAARLNFGDCFAYDVAITHSCPLLFVGDGFDATDVRPAL
jgi:ribonuclease VapC